MGREIERKFLLKNDGWRAAAGPGIVFRQGYLTAGEGNASVRVRIEGTRANLNIKSATLGVSRQEFEYPIPLADAEALLALRSGPLVEKTRYHVPHAGHTWEIDEFGGDNAGLVVAEIELETEDAAFELPPWAGEDVSHDPRYYNVMLARHPYKDW